MDQKVISDFVLTEPDLAVNPQGIEIEFLDEASLQYRRGGRSFTVRTCHTWIADLMFTTWVYLRVNQGWDGEDVPLTEAELEQAKTDIQDGLVAFNSWVLFRPAEDPQWLLDLDKDFPHLNDSEV